MWGMCGGMCGAEFVAVHACCVLGVEKYLYVWLYMHCCVLGAEEYLYVWLYMHCLVQRNTCMCGCTCIAVCLVQGNMHEHGKVLRQGDLVLVEYTKHHRRVFLFEHTIILTKKKKPKHQIHEVASSELFDFKQEYKVTEKGGDVVVEWSDAFLDK